MLADFRVPDGAAAANGGRRKCRPVSPRYGVRLTCEGKAKRQISAIYSGFAAGAKILINHQLFINSVDGTG